MYLSSKEYILTLERGMLMLFFTSAFPEPWGDNANKSYMLIHTAVIDESSQWPTETIIYRLWWIKKCGQNTPALPGC